MYITLDGCTGVGKTTQANILERTLGLKHTMMYIPETALKSVVAAIQRGRYDRFHRTNTLVFMLNLSIHQGDIGGIQEHYWEHIMAFSSKIEGKIIASNKTKEIVDFFHRGLELFKCPIPDLSVFIDAAPERRAIRLAKRTFGKDSLLDSATLTPSYYEEGWSSFFKSLEEMIPYFHVIDGNQSIEEVTESILELL